MVRTSSSKPRQGQCSGSDIAVLRSRCASWWPKNSPLHGWTSSPFAESWCCVKRWFVKFVKCVVFLKKMWWKPRTVSQFSWCEISIRCCFGIWMAEHVEVAGIVLYIYILIYIYVDIYIYICWYNIYIYCNNAKYIRLPRNSKGSDSWDPRNSMLQGIPPDISWPPYWKPCFALGFIFMFGTGLPSSKFT